MENKDLYVIELKKKVKIGITQEFNKRISTIKSSAGIRDNEIIQLFHYPDLAILESRLKFLFKKQKIAGEWFYKKDIVLDFINELKQDSSPSIEMINDLKNNNITYSKVYKKSEYPLDLYSIQKENAINLLEQIKSERVGIGYPDSIDLIKFIRSKKARYRNMIYSTDKDFKYFERTPNFSLEEITKSQSIECLRIIKNNTPDNTKKSTLQDYIDSIFSDSQVYLQEYLELIESYFFQEQSKKEKTEKYIDTNYQNIKIYYDKQGGFYSLDNCFEDTNIDEKLFLKNAKGSELEISPYGIFNFKYKSKLCMCNFYPENYLRILNFFQIEKLEKNKLRLYLNDTEGSSNAHYIFQFKYHLLNSLEKQFIKDAIIESISCGFLEFSVDNRRYYCLYDNIDTIAQELEIEISQFQDEYIYEVAEPIK